MAKTKATGTSRLGRDSLPKYLGVKLSAGQLAKPGNIIIRQRGTKYLPGKNVARAGDDSLYALTSGKVYFQKKRKLGFDNSRRLATVVNIIP